MIRLGLMVFVLILAAVPGLAQPAVNEHRITAGRSVGDIALGMSISEVVELVARPASDVQHGVYIWHLGVPRGDLVVESRAGKVAKIKVYWTTYYATPDDLHVGLLQSDIEGARGAPLRSVSWAHFRALYYPGLVFTVDRSDDLVTGIGVFSPVSVFASRPLEEPR